MNDKPKNISYNLPIESRKIETQSPFSLLNALCVKYNTRTDLIARFTKIEKNLKLVPPGVHGVVAEMLQELNLEKHISNTEIVIAAITAINPTRVIDAANDERIKITA